MITAKDINWLFVRVQIHEARNAILDNYINDHSPKLIILVSSDGTEYNVGQQISYGTNYYGEELINISANPGFKNITHFDFNAGGSNMRLVLDNINLTNIIAQSTTSSDATMKTYVAVKVVTVTQAPTATLKAIIGSLQAGETESVRE